MPTAFANCACVRPAKIRAVRNWRPETTFDKTSPYGDVKVLELDGSCPTASEYPAREHHGVTVIARQPEA